MGFLARWVRTTFDYNPTFPISALLLLLGLRLLDREGALDAETVAGTGGGLGVLQAYEVALLGLVLLVLWPRRIAYETTAILIVFGVVRYAAPFLVIGHAAEGNTGSALAFGVLLAALMALKGGAIQRGVGLDLKRWERAHDALLFALTCVGFPLLAQGLATWTGGALSHEASRGLQLATGWVFALLLAPLALDLPDLGQAGPLRSRRPAAVWRGLSVVGPSALLANALWLGGETPAPFAVLPLGLVAVAVAAAIARAAGHDLARFGAQAPALAALLVLVTPLELLLGRTPPLGRPLALLLFLPVAAACLPLISRERWRDGLPALCGVAALAPLALAGSIADAEGYALLVLLAAAAVGAVRRDDRMLAGAVATAAVLGAHLAWPALHVLALTHVPLAAGAGLLLLVAWRCPGARASAAAGLALVLAPGVVEVVRGPGVPALALLVAAGGGLAALGLRRGERHAVYAGAALPAAAVVRLVAHDVDPGVALVTLAFAALPVGTAVALGRERGREAAPDEALAPACTLAAEVRRVGTRVA